MALLFVEEDPWLLEYETCEKLSRDIMEQLNIREKYPRRSDKYSQLSASIRLRLRQFNNEVGQLKQKLQLTPKFMKITPGEAERRTRQVEILLSKGIQMQKTFDDQVVNKLNEDRQLLIGTNRPSASGGSSNFDINPSTSVLDFRTGQKRMLQEQEKGLENLSDVISRQKNIAQAISSEVDLHNDILDDLGTNMDNTDHLVRTTTNNIDVVSTNDNTCIYWISIISLFICIVVVATL